MQPFGLVPKTVILMLGTRALWCGSHFSNGSCSLALALKGGRMAWTCGAGKPAGAQDGELSLHPIVGLFCRLEPSSGWNVLFWKSLLVRSFIPMAAGVREGCSSRSWQWESSTLLRYHPCETANVSKRKPVSVSYRTHSAVLLLLCSRSVLWLNYVTASHHPIVAAHTAIIVQIILCQHHIWDI